MEIIPVLDLKGGQAVHARLGQRDRYAPLRSKLCSGSDPLDVARGYRQVYPFATLYVADLDAIGGEGDNQGVVERLRGAFPDLRLWVDRGLAEDGACRAWLARGLGDLVLGSETQRDPALLARLRAGPDAARVILSLDFMGGRFLGPEALLRENGGWPERVIVMTLGRVGGDRGPDLARLRAIGGRAAGRSLIAAGGLRGAGDLTALADLGVGGVLVASALHDGRIGRREISARESRPPR